MHLLHFGSIILKNCFKNMKILDHNTGDVQLVVISFIFIHTGYNRNQTILFKSKAVKTVKVKFLNNKALTIKALSYSQFKSFESCRCNLIYITGANIPVVKISANIFIIRTNILNYKETVNSIFLNKEFSFSSMHILVNVNILSFFIHIIITRDLRI